MRRTVRYEMIKNTNNSADFTKPPIINHNMQKLQYDIDSLCDLILTENKTWTSSNNCKISENFSVCGNGINTVACEKYLDRPKLKVNGTDKFLVLFGENDNIIKLTNGDISASCSGLLYKQLDKISFSKKAYVDNIVKNSKQIVFDKNKATIGDVVIYLHFGQFTQNESISVTNKSDTLSVTIDEKELIFDIDEQHIGKVLEHVDEQVTVFVRVNPIYEQFTQSIEKITEVPYSSETYVDFLLRANNDLKDVEFIETNSPDIIYEKTSDDFELHCKTTQKPTAVVFEKVNNTTIKCKCTVGEQELSKDIQLNRTLMEKGILKFELNETEYAEIEFPILHGDVEVVSDIKEYLKEFTKTSFDKKFNGYENLSKNSHGKYSNINKQSLIFVVDDSSTTYTLGIVENKIKITSGSVVKEYQLNNSNIGKITKFVFNNKNAYVDLRNIYQFTLKPKSKARKTNSKKM